MIDWILTDFSLPKFIMLFISSCVFVITLVSLFINFIDWLTNVYLYTKMGWFQFSYPNFDNSIIKIKYSNYIVGYMTGEIFYVDEKRLKRLKRKKLLDWDSEMGYYIFHDDNVEEIKKNIMPLIKVSEESIQTSKSYYS